jgi:predicted transcriptional regulator
MKLAEHMDKKGITETEMARLLGVSQPTVSRYLNGERMPKPRNMAKIVAVTGGRVRPDDFYALKPRRG